MPPIPTDTDIDAAPPYNRVHPEGRCTNCGEALTWSPCANCGHPNPDTEAADE